MKWSARSRATPRQSHTNLHTATSFSGGPEAAHAHCGEGRGGGCVPGIAKRCGNWDNKEVDLTGNKLSGEDF